MYLSSFFPAYQLTSWYCGPAIESVASWARNSMKMAFVNLGKVDAVSLCFKISIESNTFTIIAASPHISRSSINGIKTLRSTFLSGVQRSCDLAPEQFGEALPLLFR